MVRIFCFSRVEWICVRCCYIKRLLCPTIATCMLGLTVCIVHLRLSEYSKHAIRVSISMLCFHSAKHMVAIDVIKDVREKALEGC